MLIVFYSHYMYLFSYAEIIKWKKIDMHQPYYHSLRIAFIKAKYLSLIVGLMAWFQGKDKYLNTIKKRLEVHGTVYVDEKAKTKRSYMPSFVTNHGLQKPEDFHILLRKSKVATVILKLKLYLNYWKQVAGLNSLWISAGFFSCHAY